MLFDCRLVNLIDIILFDLMLANLFIVRLYIAGKKVIMDIMKYISLFSGSRENKNMFKYEFNRLHVQTNNLSSYFLSIKTTI